MSKEDKLKSPHKAWKTPLLTQPQSEAALVKREVTVQQRSWYTSNNHFRFLQSYLSSKASYPEAAPLKTISVSQMTIAILPPWSWLTTNATPETGKHISERDWKITSIPSIKVHLPQVKSYSLALFPLSIITTALSVLAYSTQTDQPYLPQLCWSPSQRTPTHHSTFWSYPPKTWHWSWGYFCITTSLP